MVDGIVLGNHTGCGGYPVRARISSISAGISRGSVRRTEPGVEVEIQKAYPGAHDIEVIHAANGFNKRLCCVQVKFKVGNPANSALYSEKVETLLFLRVDRGWLPVSKSHSSIIQPLLVNLFIAECDFVS